MCTRFDSEVNSHTSTRKLVTTLPMNPRNVHEFFKPLEPRVMFRVQLCNEYGY